MTDAAKRDWLGRVSATLEQVVSAKAAQGVDARSAVDGVGLGRAVERVRLVGAFDLLRNGEGAQTEDEDAGDAPLGRFVPEAVGREVPIAGGRGTPAP